MVFTRVKICGITRKEDALTAEKYGADAIGVILFSNSLRSVSIEHAEEIFSSVGPFIATVAVTHTRSAGDLERITDIGPSAIQISSNFSRPPAFSGRLIRVVGRGDSIPADCDAIIIDESRGTGTVFDESSAREIVRRSRRPVILAGGLTPSNVAVAIRSIHPYAVDVCSGVEYQPGIKDPELIRRFIEAVKTEFVYRS